MSQDQPALWRELIRALALGHPVPVDELVTRLDLTQDDVIRSLRSCGDIEYDDDGSIVGAGLTLVPTAHQFIIDGRTLYTWCALDTLVYAILLNARVQVLSRCPLTDLEISLRVGPEEAISLEHPPPLLAIAPLGTECCETGSVRAEFCDHTHFVASEPAARQWLGRHPGGTVLDLEAGHRLAREMAMLRTG